MKEKMTDHNLELIGRLEGLGRKYGKTISQVALAWLLGQPDILAPVFGADSVSQLTQNYT
jgi:aryl-alcohol dehydrogenase-like predicted oxidoreductase